MPLIRNPNASPMVLSGFRELAPGETIRVADDVVRRYGKSVEVMLDDDEAEGQVINFTGAFDPQDGYGIGSISVVRQLLARGWNVAYSGFDPPPGIVPADLEPVVRHRALRTPKIGLARTIPPVFARNQSPVRFGWTMWDATRLPSDWVPACNAMDYLIVPSAGQAEIFRSSGVTVPLYPIPEPLDLDEYPAVKRPERDTFTFFSIARMCDRKCPLELVECFRRAFPSESDVRLVVKTRDRQFGMGMLGIPAIGDERVRVIDGRLPLDEVRALFHDADAGVFLSHGEGFYQGCVQAMATGLPTILPNHSGCSDYANPRFNYPVRLDPKRPVVPTDYYRSHLRNDEPFEWWQLDYDHVVELMREVYQNRSKARAKGQQAASWVRKKFDLTATIDAVEKIIKPLVS